MSNSEVSPANATGTRAARNRRESRWEKIFVWFWGITQLVGGVTLAYFADRFVTDPVALSVVKPLLIFFGTALGVTYVALEFQIDGVLSRELSTIRNDLLEQRDGLDANVRTVISNAVHAELADLRNLLPVFDAYLSIGSEDSFGSRDRILGVARNQLEQLSRGKFEIEGDDYYDWLKIRLTKKRPESVRAISFRPLSVYVNDPREKNFIKNNSDSIKSGTVVQRIFVLERDELLDPVSRAILKSHFCDSGALCFVAWKSELSRQLRSKLEGGGLSIYDTDNVFFDRSYFAVKLGDERESSSAGTQEVVPRAVVYSRSDPDFRTFEQLFDNLLTNFVDPASRDLRGLDAYRWCCQNVASWAASSSQADEKIEALRSEIDALS